MRAASSGQIGYEKYNLPPEHCTLVVSKILRILVLCLALHIQLQGFLG